MKEVDLERRLDGDKVLWHMDRVIAHYDKGERIAPVHIDMGITKYCNVGCVFCYGKYQEMSKDRISDEALLQTMRDAGDIGVRSIGLIGDGEPSVHPKFYEALREGKKYGVSMATSTNGVKITEDEQRAAVLESCDWMRFCFSAGTKEGYKKIHSVDKFDQAVKNVRDMVNYRDKHGLDCDIGMQAVFVPTLMGQEMIDEAKLATKLGVDYFTIKQCSLPDKGDTGMMQFDVNDYSRPDIIAGLEEAEAQSNERTKVMAKWNVMGLKGEKPYHGCPSIPLISEMSGNGDWYPCGYMFGEHSKFRDGSRFGNVHEQTLKEIWESDRYWEIIKKMRDFKSGEDCHGCCRQDQVNISLDKYLNKPKGINFI